MNEDWGRRKYGAYVGIALFRELSIRNMYVQRILGEKVDRKHSSPSLSLGWAFPWVCWISRARSLFSACAFHMHISSGELCSPLFVQALPQSPLQQQTMVLKLDNLKILPHPPLFNPRRETQASLVARHCYILSEHCLSSFSLSHNNFVLKQS